MSLTRKASTAAKKPDKPPRQTLAAARAELAEARRQQAATAEILRVISQSPTDAQPVFSRIVVAAAQLLRCDMVAVLLREGAAYFQAAGATPEGPMADLAPVRIVIDPDANFPSRAFLSKAMLHLPDWSQIDLPEHERRVRETFGVNSALFLPLLRGDVSISMLVFIGKRANAFGPSEIAQAETFRDQALITIENARLFRETQEALERQTATADILKVIASSPGDVQPVFEAIATSANRLLGGISTTTWRFIDDALILVGFTPTSPAADKALQAAFPRPLAEFPPFLPARDGKTEQFIDTEAESGVPSLLRDLGRLRGFRSMLFAPLMSNGVATGLISVTRKEPGAFVDADVQLLRTFANQAVIAIENARLFRETQESLRQQTATSDILRVIASSPGNLQPVLDRLAETTCRLCEANDALLFLREDGNLRLAAHHGPIPTPAGFVERPISRDWIAGRSVADREPIHVHDLAAAADEYPLGVSLAKEAAGAATPGLAWRTTLSMPLMREGEAVGAITLRRVEVGPFTDAQTALLRTFADQAVIAIENARLFDEVQAKTRDLTEALEQQTATADVLKAISRTAFDLDMVLETLVSTAARLCSAKHGQIFRRHGDVYRYAASRMDVDPAYLRHEQTTEIKPGRGTLVGRVALERRAIEIADAWNDPEYAEKEEARVGGVRAMLGVPLMRDGEPIGAFALARSEPVPFTPGQIALVQTFADQAVVAIENVRLFNETQAALERQTATADILKVIASSPTDVQPVFEAIAASANKLIGGFSTAVLRFVGEAIHLAAFTPANPTADEVLRTSFPRAIAEFPPFALVRGGETIQFTDTEADSVPSLEPGTRAPARLSQHADHAAREQGAAIGMISVTRKEPGDFAAHHVQLLKTFADQAVIAIENVRLFDEVQAKTRDLEESLQQQTATADVLKAISRSAFDLETVLESLISTALRLCNAKQGVIFRRHGDIYRYAASHMLLDPAYRAHEQTAEIKAGRGTLIGRVALENRTVQIEDAWGDPDYAEKDEIRRTKVRSMLGVPLLRNGEPIGAFGLGREEPVPFTQRQIELVTTFADQAVIAIENVRLFDEVQARTRDLEESLEQQTATAEVLKVISRSVFDLQTVLDTLVQSAYVLCGAGAALLYLRSDDGFECKAIAGGGAEDVGHLFKGRPIRAGRNTAAERVIMTGEVHSIADLFDDPEVDPKVTAGLRGAGLDFRSTLAVPMKRDDAVVGVLVIARGQTGSFPQRQVDLLQTFADQAVIAMENVRLFNEVKARTEDLSESLRQQTATADVLKVISRSAFDLDAVFEALLASAVSLIGSRGGTICVREGEGFRYRAVAEGRDSAMWRYLSEHPPPRDGRRWRAESCSRASP